MRTRRIASWLGVEAGLAACWRGWRRGRGYVSGCGSECGYEGGGGCVFGFWLESVNELQSVVWLWDLS